MDNQALDLWLTLKDAATRLGISPRTARRWVKEGRLQAELRPGPYGETYYVAAVALDQAVREPAPLRAAVDVAGDLRPVAVMLEALRAEVAGLRAEVEGLRTGVDSLRVEHGQTHEAVKRLLAAPGATVPQIAGEPSTPPQRPWWRFWGRA
jgi:excisionase family DNA binding protein